MRITINPVLDMETLQWVSSDGAYDYIGPVDMYCSSGGQVGATDEALQQSQVTLNNTLSSDYSTTFAEQQNVLAQQQARLNYLASNPLGYSPEELHTATTSINDNTATAAKQAIGAASAFAGAHGGADVGSGVTGEIAGEIGSAAAQSKANQLANLSNSNQQMKRQNFWNAIGGLNSVGSEYGGAGATAIGGANSAANSAVGAGAGAIQAQEAQTGLLGGIISGISGLGQAGVGAYTSLYP